MTGVLTAHDLCLDAPNHIAHVGGEEIRLRPKCFAVLRYLMEHPGRLVVGDHEEVRKSEHQAGGSGCCLERQF